MNCLSRRSLWILVAALVSSPILAANRLPNVVVILADDMGYGDPKCYNAQSKTPTPNIDRLAAEGIRFTDAHSAGATCVPTRYGLLTGRYPLRVRAREWRRRALINEKRWTVASLLKRAGYGTAMIGKWHLGFEGGPDYDYTRRLGGGPVDRGFDDYFGIPHSLDIQPYYYIRGDRAESPPTVDVAANQSPGWTRIQGKFWRAGKMSKEFFHADVLPRLTLEAVRYVESHTRRRPEQPFFLYFALPAPHTPWLPSREFVGRSQASLYGDFVAMVDAAVGELLRALQAHGAEDNTLVIFTSDNGPVWYEEDVKRFEHASVGDLRGMKGDAWEGGHRIPFVARWPGRIAPQGASDALISQVDLMATLAEIVGAPLPRGEGIDSISFLPTLVGHESRSPRRQSLVVQSRAMVVRRGPWKLIPQLGSAGFSEPRRVKPVSGGPTGQLYNLATDLSETRNLWQEQPQVVAQLQSVLKAYRALEHTDETP